MSEKIQKFEDLFDLEFQVRGAKASLALRPCGTPTWRLEQMHRSLRSAQAKLFAAIDALTVEEMDDYGIYRLQYTR
jgi:hypothetical protein